MEKSETAKIVVKKAVLDGQLAIFQSFIKKACDSFESNT